MRTRSVVFALSVLALSALPAATAHAITLSGSDSYVSPEFVSTATIPELAASPTYTRSVPFDFSVSHGLGHIGGTLDLAVYRAADQTLTFTYRANVSQTVFSTPSSPGFSFPFHFGPGDLPPNGLTLDAFQLSDDGGTTGFGGSVVRVQGNGGAYDVFLTGGLTADPNAAPVQAGANTFYSYLPSSSHTLVLKTNATDYALSALTFPNPVGNSQPITDEAPVPLAPAGGPNPAPVPEPAAAGTLGLAVAALAGRMSRRRRA